MENESETGNQQHLMQLQILEQRTEQISQQIKMIDNQIAELGVLKYNLSAFNSSPSTELYSEFGKGIFIKSKIDKKEFLVDAGNKVFVPKTFEDIKEVINSQIVRFEELKSEMSDNLFAIKQQVDRIINSMHSAEYEHEHKHTSECAHEHKHTSFEIPADNPKVNQKSNKSNSKVKFKKK
ncbi:hypothetical protein J4463_03125 [Candidatus Pacearchaeota archaeon]|nr:hypothetical protein [Candidatus Pacearchaeota archaeon]